MPGFAITRGLGPGSTPSSMIARGFFPTVIAETVRIIRGGRSAASRAIKDLTETFKISAMLIEANGKELVQPILNTVRKTFNMDKITTVKIIPKKLRARKSQNIKVIVENVKVRNKDVIN